MHGRDTMEVSFWERMALVIGGGAIGAGLGVLMAGTLGTTPAYWLILTGILLHGWGMYAVGQRNK